MHIIEELMIIERIHLLIKRKGTGTPSELSRRFHLSKRTTFRLIKKMKDLGFPIEYCRDYRSYIYKKECKINIVIPEGSDFLVNIKGGSIQMIGDTLGLPKTRQF